jgi:sugar lactone lactonase YvrE
VTLLTFAIACEPRAQGGYDSRPSFGPAEESDTDTDTDSDTDSDTDTDTDTDSDSDTGTKPPAFDCEHGIPEPPYDGRRVVGSITAEDVDVDNEGYIVGSDRDRLYRTSRDGTQEMLHPDAGNPQAVHVLPSGDVVFFKETTIVLDRLDPTGGVHTVVDGYYLPYVDADASGRVYASSVAFGHTESQILRIDPVSKAVDVIVDEFEHGVPWGISLAEDYRAVYVAGNHGIDGEVTDATRIYRVPLDEKGDAEGEPELFVEFEGPSRWTEGLAVDICGNVYVSRGSEVWRISKDGSRIDPIWTADRTDYRVIAGLAFGREGEGGTDPLALYASNPYEKEAFEIDAGVLGKPRW